MNAAIYINSDFAGQRPYGYSNFYIPLSRFLRFGADNTIKVIADTGDDSLWYTGAGIYRNVNILFGALIHFAIDSVKITSTDIEDDYAVIEIKSVIENSGHRPAQAFVAAVSIPSFPRNIFHDPGDFYRRSIKNP
jgi:beta-galactosidase